MESAFPDSHNQELLKARVNRLLLNECNYLHLWPHLHFTPGGKGVNRSIEYHRVPSLDQCCTKYIRYDIPTVPSVTTVATFADDTAFLSTSSDPPETINQLLDQLDATKAWPQKWRIRASALQSQHITFTLRLEPPCQTKWKGPSPRYHCKIPRLLPGPTHDVEVPY